MKVSELRNILDNYSHDDHVAIKWYDKFEFEQNLEEDLSDKNWAIMCEEFEQDDSIEQMCSDFLSMKADEYQESQACGVCYLVKCECDSRTDAYLESQLD